MIDIPRPSFICPGCKQRSRVKSLEQLKCEHCGWSSKSGAGTGTNKYRAVKKMVDGIQFDSSTEARRYMQLRLLERAGKIRDLEIQPEYQIDLGPGASRKYLADFRYINEFGNLVVEDVKSKATRTPIYRLKKQAVEAQYGIRILETSA